MIAPNPNPRRRPEPRYQPVVEPKLDGLTVECPDCDGKIANDQVVEDHAVRSRDHNNQLVMPCRFYCPHCSHIVVWLAGVDAATGKRNRNIIAQPGFIRDKRRISAFLEKHPKACETAPL